MEVSGQYNALAALPPNKHTPEPIRYEVWSVSGLPERCGEMEHFLPPP
jgi:hypothetical protein